MNDSELTKSTSSRLAQMLKAGEGKRKRFESIDFDWGTVHVWKKSVKVKSDFTRELKAIGEDGLEDDPDWFDFKLLTVYATDKDGVPLATMDDRDALTGDGGIDADDLRKIARIALEVNGFDVVTTESVKKK